MAPDAHGQRNRALTGAALGLCAVFLFFVHRQILTYVCGNDPMLYIRAARVLLAPGLYGAEAVRHALTFVAPGYPVILAVAIKLFGSLSPYWVNLFFLLATLPLMRLVFRRLMGSERAAAFTLCGLLAIAFGSHELNAPFLLYPFREASRVFFIYAAYACLLQGLRADGVRRAWVLGASLATLGACAIREPSALVLPGLLLGMAGLSPEWRSRLRAWGWFLLPWAVVGAGAALLLSQVALVDISQFSVVRYLGNHHVALERGRTMLGWFPARVGWLAVGLMALGVARALWRSRVLCAWFLLPGVLFFVFCAYMQMHVRYFLSSLLFLAVFAGYGLDGLCAALERVAGGAGTRPWLRPALTWGVLGLLGLGLWHTAVQTRVWGPKVEAGEVRAWQALVAGLEPSADGRVRVALEQRSRYLEDLLLAYTDADLLDPKQVERWPSRWAPAHYFRPLNRQALYATPQWLMWLKIYAHRILADRMDLLPAGAAEPVIRTVGKGRYEQYLLRPWSAGEHRQEFDLKPGQSQVAWLDWGSLPADTPRTVKIVDPATGSVWFSGSVEGNGLQAILLDGASVKSGRGYLTVSSAAPVPARPLFDVVGASVPHVFPHDADRRVSLNRLLSGRESEALEDTPLVWAVGRRKTLLAPVVHAGAGGVWTVCFAGKVEAPDQLLLQARREDGKQTTREVAAAEGACLTGVGSGEILDLALEAAHDPPRGRWLIDRVSFGFHPAGRRGE